MGNRSRREFLAGAGFAIGSATLGMRLWGEVPTIGTDSTNPDNDSTPQISTGRGKMRGLMVDAARVPEPLDYYRRVIDFCADWELNALQFRVTDDQGTALRFTSVPHLITHKNAFTPEQLRDLAEYGKSHGVDVIPELESFGHTGYITRSSAYAHLLDSDAQASSEFSGIIPVHPETLQIFRELYREVATIFPSVYLHGGCDEVNWGGSALSRKALETKTRTQIWAEYLNSLDHISASNQRQFIVWGDMVVRKEPEILSALNKTIIIMDWNYRDHTSEAIHDTFLKASVAGHSGIGAPALVNYQWGPRAGTAQLRNIDAYADAYLAEPDPKSMGVILTNWEPCRYIQNSIWDGFAYAAVAFNKGSADARTSAFRYFVEKHYRAGWSDEWHEAFQIIWDSAPGIQERPMPPNAPPPLRVPWSSDEQLAGALKLAPPGQNPFTHLRSLLVQLEPQVLKNLADFQAFALSAEALERMFWRDAVVIEYAAKRPPERETASLLIQAIAERDQALVHALTDDWDSGRFADSAAKTELVFDLEPKDQLLFEWRQAAQYSTSLAGQPDRFYEILEAANLA
jgi:hypothetical protein